MSEFCFNIYKSIYTKIVSTRIIGHENVNKRIEMYYVMFKYIRVTFSTNNGMARGSYFYCVCNSFGTDEIIIVQVVRNKSPKKFITIVNSGSYQWNNIIFIAYIIAFDTIVNKTTTVRKLYLKCLLLLDTTCIKCLVRHGIIQRDLNEY